MRFVDDVDIVRTDTNLRAMLSLISKSFQWKRERTFLAGMKKEE
jgi:hypothetical protein